MARGGLGAAPAAALAALLGIMTLVAVAGCGVTPQADAPRTPDAPARIPAPAANAAPSTDPAPVRVLDLPLGPELHQPGATTARVGGISPRGPGALAVDGERIYLWDRARARVLIYEGGDLVDRVAVPWAGPEATDLRVHADRLYLTELWGTDRVELVADVTNGALLHLARWPRGIAGSVYPGRLPPPEERARNEKPAVPDRAGIPAGEGDLVQQYVAADGSAWALFWVWADGRLSRARVLRVAPAAAPGGPSTPTPDAPTPDAMAPDASAPDAPAPPVPAHPEQATFHGLATPAWVAVAAADRPPVRLAEPATLSSLWRVLAAVEPAPSAPPMDSARAELIRLTAGWPGGETLELHLAPYHLYADGKAYEGVGTALLHRLLAYEGSRPEHLAAAVRRHGAVLRLPDLPDVGRRLTPAEAEQLAAALADAFAVRTAEPPRPLEPPFPRYEVVVEMPDGAVLTLSPAGDRHLWVGRWGAVAVPPGLTDLLARWLPVPSAAPGEVAWLYRAEALTIRQGEQTEQDLTRWQATVVRALLNGHAAADRPGFGGGPLVFTFTVDGRPEVVTVTEEGYTYAGRFYPQSGLLGLLHLQSVP